MYKELSEVHNENNSSVLNEQKDRNRYFIKQDTLRVNKHMKDAQNY